MCACAYVIVVNYCSCVLNKIMPPKGGSERSELTPCTIYVYCQEIATTKTAAETYISYMQLYIYSSKEINIGLYGLWSSYYYSYYYVSFVYHCL